MPTFFKCNITLPTLIALRTHLKFAHKLTAKQSDTIRCAEIGCFSSFSGWREFRVHLLSRHMNDHLKKHSSVQNLSSNKLCDSDCATSCTQGPNEDKVCNEPCTSDLLSSHCDTEHSVHSNSENSGCSDNVRLEDALHNTVLEFTAKLYANHALPRKHVVEIIKEISSSLQLMLDIIKPAITKIVLKHCNDDSISAVEAELDAQLDLMVSPFLKLSSEHLYLKVLKEKKNLLPSTSYFIGARIFDVMQEGHMVKKLCDVSAKIISMRAVLQKIFSLPLVFSSVNAYVKKLQLDDTFVQGKLWREKVRNHFQGKVVFSLFMYYDDFELGNALGSHAGIQKLGGVYYSVPCFPPEVQSQIENVFIAALFHSADRVDFRNHSVFKNILTELNSLQSEGVVINGGDGPIKIYFALGLVLGDNLGLNQILGFQESFNANFSCRLCKTSKFQMQWETNEARLRTPDTYDSDVLLSDPKITGIKENSVWNEVNYFKTCENFYVDYLHDGPEGAFKKFMSLIIYYFAFTLKSTKDSFLIIMNDRLKSFDCYHNLIKNRPPVISYEEAKEKHLKMSANEMQTFVLIFSMLVGDVVPHDDSVWQFYLCMRKVDDYVHGRCLPKVSVNLFKTFIREMYEMYLRVFPNDTVTSKVHMFVHYPTVYENSGPIINLSTYKYERKHKDKKAEANATSSRRNTTETLCVKELLKLAYRFVLGKRIAPNNGSAKHKVVHNLPSKPGFCMLDLNGNYKKMVWIRINGQLYRNGSCVITDMEGDNEVFPLFGIIELILQNDEGEIIFVYKSCVTLEFCSEYHAYQVNKTRALKYVLQSNLVTPFPAVLAPLNGNFYVTLRHPL